MALKTKLALFIAGSGLVLSLSYLWLNHLTISHSLEEQKHILAMKVASRVFEMVASEKKRIGTICFDWAAWDAMFDYADRQTREFESQSMPAAVIPEYDLNIIIVLNRMKKTIYHEGYDRLRKRPVRFDPGHPKNAYIWRKLALDFDRQSLQSFFSDSEHGPVILVSSPILHSDGRGPINGRVVMGRLVNEDFNERIGAAIQESTALLDPARLPGYLDAGQKERLRRDGLLLTEIRQLFRVFCAYTDPEGRPAFVIRADADRALFSLQEKASRNFLVSLWLSTLLLGLLLFGFIDRMLLKRLEDISHKTTDITTFKDLSIRVPEERRDEISQLSQNINKMLQRLEKESIRQREMEDRLVMNEKLVATGRLAANMAHEINNPLFAIANSIAVIKRQLKNAGGDVGEVLPLAEKEIARVRKITRKLLDHGKVNLETFVWSDINAILSTACDVLKLGKRSGRTAIVREDGEKELPVLCNPDSLQQVFMNLIVNASEAMAGHGEIAIAVERRPDAYAIHFRDQGPGFPDAIRNKIFEPFNSSKNAKGAGLGLYISYHIVQRHGGAMTLDESGAGGAHLVVTLPRCRGTAHA
ncbi:MAG: ATP-binding protein [Acidobacteria bacterium]|jgi:signal transduction histidine kinase|nr:ATP-binding protein [Acidobacteriota bacterium]